jgi:hypothetical protein
MISRRHRCIFVHQRKCAGTSVKALFEDATGKDRGRFNNGVLDPEWSRDHPLVRDFHKFTVVRNPWDRFVSGWRYCASTRDRPLIDVLENLPRERLLANVFAPGASFQSRYAYARELVRRQRELAEYLLRDHRRGRLRPLGQGHDFRHITRQQVESVVYADGTLAVDRVIFFERLDEGLAELARDVGLPTQAVPRRGARREGDDYRRYFDAASLALFDRIFARDVAAWGYDFETGLPAAVR